MMGSELKWDFLQDGVVGSEVLKGKKPYKAFARWMRDGQIIKSADFTLSELKDEIQTLRASGEDVTGYETAMRLLDKKIREG